MEDFYGMVADDDSGPSDGDTGCDPQWASTHVSEPRQPHDRRISVLSAVAETRSCDPTYMCNYLDKQACCCYTLKV